MLVEVEAPMSSVLPTTKYFEIDSERVGARFGVWVTLPPRYDVEDVSYPVIYQPDGNKAAPTTAAAHGLLRDDPINPIRPFIQVCVGYPGADARRMLAVRARDLLPPGEPLLPGDHEAGMEKLVTAGLLSEPDARLYLDYLRNPQGDRFLAFLATELDPAIRRRFRVSDEDTGLHGFSYGGLFAAYAAVSTDRFELVGAGSPGILAGTSKVFSRFDEAATDPSHPTARHLHVTVCERELTHPSIYQEQVGTGAMELVAKAGHSLAKSMRVTSALTPLESHATGSAASWFSFLRTCYPAPTTTGLLDRPVEANPTTQNSSP